MNYLEGRGLERQRSRTTFDSQVSCAVVKCGYLWKTSHHLGERPPKADTFVLTKSSLDQFRNQHREKLKGSLPLAAIETVEKLPEDYRSLKITGPFKHPLVLQASGKEDCQEWIKAIENGIQQWRLDSDASSPTLQKNLKDELDGFQSCLNAVPKMKMLYPSLFRPAGDGVLFSAGNELHHEFPMIKYARGGRSIPHERVFKLDNDNLHIMWKKRGRAHSFTFTNTVCLDRVIEVRCGQQTKNFVKFPYTEVESQSFSLMFEKQQGDIFCYSVHENGVNCVSLDLICDSPKAFEKWTSAMREVIYSRDQRVNRHKFDGVDPVVLWLKRHWSVMSSRHSKGISVDQALSFAHRCCSSGAKRKLIRNYVKDVLEAQCGIAQHNENLLWNSFLMLFNSLNEQPRLHNIFCKYAKEHPNLGMTPAEFAEFLNREQEESLSLAACARLMSVHDKFHMMYKQKCAGDNPESYRLSKSFLSYHGFLSYLRSQDNSAVNPEHNTVYQEMDQPLTDYFINSSHNTYLTGRQLKGKSSLEAYVRALLQGCRCVELDCWDGPDEPVITHGLTLTSKIRFRDVVQVIREYAFEASEFPLILSLENHCNELQQAIMADIFVTELGDMLATNNLSDELGIHTLPSPKDLMGKIFLKGKIKVKKKHKISTAIWPGVNVNPIGFSPRLKKTSKVLMSSQSEAVLARTASSHSFQPRLRSVTTTTIDDKGSTNEELYNVVPLEDAMGKLIVYCRAVHYKKNEISGDCCEMYSFNDGVAQDSISGHPRDILSLANKHIVRTYPKGSRVDSSNYNPQTMWNAGIQMVAINFQKPDSGMHLNQGKFRKNGGCGYILKPDSLRNREKSNYHPMIKESPKNGKSCYFTIEVLSGQYLHVDEDSQLPIRVDVETVGVPEDCAILSTEPTMDKLNPQFENTKQLFKIIMPELCLVYFKVHLLNRNKSRLLSQNVISLDSLRPGIHYIRLRSPTGVKIPHSGLFVRIKLQEFEPSSCKVKGTSRERLLTF
ncbi:1-phosphatidylinositol 4,5-bisphosphate phosphodiesterase beta-4 [Desmophyllum pertusum]|uniref:Phosphoinositide phospholipase C n=1 Tax=Desmophyllum pertusum TaxID=174260 RepID=A0A9W9Z0C7_9CNID|nr:1-phosphatidylinositol 4,5-bisphosphate phosphodiesterase beta-4 [Desmophyllum pertusum]